MPIDDNNMFSLTGINKTTDELVVMDLDNSTDNVSLHSSSNTNNIDTLNIKNILNKDTNKDLNLSAYDGTSINPIIQINNTHQHINITSNLNVASNLNLQGSIIISAGNNSLKSTTITEYINGNDNYSIINLCPHNGPNGGGNAHADKYSGIDFRTNHLSYNKTSAFLRYIPTNNFIRGELHMGASEGLIGDHTTSCSASLKIKSSGVEVVGTTTSSTLNVTGATTLSSTLNVNNQTTITKLYNKIRHAASPAWTGLNTTDNSDDSNAYAARFYTGKTPSGAGYFAGPTNMNHFIDIGGYLAGGPYMSETYEGSAAFPTITTNFTRIFFSVNYNYVAHIANTNVGVLDFTGQHRSKIINIDINTIQDYIGMIVVSTGKLDNLDKNVNEFKPNINESLPIVELSNKKKDKSVFGVLSDVEDENNNNREYNTGNFVSVYPKKDSSDNRVFINSVGEGAIWIVNTNGNLENGDYIQSSDVIGHGEKQTSEFLANYTVAKITMNCTFDINSNDYDCVEFIDSTSGNTYRKAFVGCTYHCG